MDLRAYYEKIREAEKGMISDFVIAVSNETGDGGRAGVMTEVTRGIAARMIVEGRARAASSEEAAEFKLQVNREREAAEVLAQAGRLQFAVVSAADSRGTKAAPKPAKA